MTVRSIKCKDTDTIIQVKIHEGLTGRVITQRITHSVYMYIKIYNLNL